MHLPLELSCPIQRYAWGSTDGIARVTGNPDHGGFPAAELWMGAHPLGPCFAARREAGAATGNDPKDSLASLIEREPAEMLGGITSVRYGASLPFLFKILSAARPLSLQVHPNLDKARAGFAREDALGIPIDSPERCFRDRNQKSELIMALTPFTCLCGFRAVTDSVGLMSELESEAFSPALSYLRNTGDYRGFLASLLSLPAAASRELAREARRLAKARTAITGPFSYVSYLAEHYPDDIGIISPLYLNSLALSPGEALFLDPGIPHTYLEGTALELMTNSDNVLRGGLTAKKIQTPEFLDVLDPSVYEPSILVAAKGESAFRRFITPCGDFELSVAELDSSDAAIPSGKPAILLVTEGAMKLSCADVAGWRGDARKGSVHFIPAAASRITISGTGRAYLASLPADSGYGA